MNNQFTNINICQENSLNDDNSMKLHYLGCNLNVKMLSKHSKLS